MKNEIQFIKKIKVAYIQNGFGRLLKTDIDIIVFDYIISDLLKDNETIFLSDGSINYQAISLNDIYNISRRLKISESKVKNLIYAASLKFQSQATIKETFSFILRENIMKIIPPKEKLIYGQIKIYVPNIVFKQEIEMRLSNLGGIPDYSFNKDILSIEIIDFIFLLKSHFVDKEMKDLCTGLIKKVKLSEKDEDYKNFLTCIDKKESKEILQLFLKDLGKKVIGKSSDVALDFIFEFIVDQRR